MNKTEETLEQIPEKGELLKAIENLSNRFDNLENKFDKLENKFDKLEKGNNAQFESIREGLVYNNAKFDRLESIALEGKSISLSVRSQLTLLIEEIHQMRKEPVM